MIISNVPCSVFMRIRTLSASLLTIPENQRGVTRVVTKFRAITLGVVRCMVAAFFCSRCDEVRAMLEPAVLQSFEPCPLCGQTSRSRLLGWGVTRRNLPVVEQRSVGWFGMAEAWHKRNAV